jgi:hypothetical protein
MPGEWGQLALDNKFQAIDDRLRRIETTLKALAGDAGVAFEDPTDGVPEEVVELAKQGKSTEAAAAYRKATGADLKEAMGVVARI